MRRLRCAWAIAVVGSTLVAAGCTAGSATDSATTVATGSSATKAPNDTLVPTRSAGCDMPGDAVADQSVPLTWAGAERAYIVDVPEMATSGHPAPLVVDLHGFGEGATFHHAETAFAELGKSEGFITVTPAGQGSVAFFDARLGSSDIGFVGAVIDDLERTHCIDASRVYATGFSNGAFLTSALSCDLANRFAAAAPVAGIRDLSGCDPTRPVPVIAFHGTDDQWMSFNGGLSQKASQIPIPPEWTGPTDLPGITALVPGSIDEPVPDTVTAWAKRNGCDDKARESRVSEDTDLVTYECPTGAEVELYRVTGGGHTWPGSQAGVALAAATGKTTFTIDATALIWKFFSTHSLNN